MRRIAGFGFEHVNPVVLDELTDRALLVVAIAEDARAGRADLDAGRLQSLGDPVITPRALVRDVPALVEETRAVRAGLHAVLATDAIGMVDDDDAVFGLVGRAGWAYLHAGRMGTVVAPVSYTHLTLPTN